MLHIAYFNAYCLPYLFTDMKYDSEERAKKIVTLIHGYDLVILNEAWTNSAKEVFRKVMEYSYDTTKTWYKFFDSGLMILSKYPIENTDFLLYKNGAGWDWFASKGVIHFTLTVNDKRLVFLTTHLQAGYSDCDQSARDSQISELISFVNHYLPNNNDVFFIGDFNVMPIINGKRSVHTHDMTDAIERDRQYKAILQGTGLTDVNIHHLQGVYHVLTRRTNLKIAYYSTHGYTDGPYFTVDIPI